MDIPRGRVFADADWVHLPAPPITAPVHMTTVPGILLVADGDGMALTSGGAITERLAAPLAGTGRRSG